MIRLLVIFFFFPNWINSQQIINQKQNGEPVEIYAEQGIEWHKNDNKYLAIGNAIAKSGKMSVNSDRIEAFYEESDNSGMDIKLVKAHRNVVVTDENLKIVGGKLAEYNLRKDYFSIFGKNLILTSQENKLESNNKMEYWRTKGVAIASGKAKAQKGNEFKIKAEKLVWYLNENDKKIDVKKIFGFENVSIYSNNEVAFSDKALYNKENGICKLFGNVKLQKGDSFLTGDYAEVDLNKGISKLLPAPNFDKLNENRVRALIDKKQNFEE
ncbi:MAG: LptA/OstA family protein [Alphaproteobacteria bacterium]